MSSLSESCDSELIDDLSTSRQQTHRIRIKKRRISSFRVDPIISIPKPLAEEPETINVCWSRIQIEKWSPSTSQQATLTSNSSCLYLVGGISRTINQDIYVFNTVSKEWSKLSTSSSLEPRFGHTCVSYSNSLLIFGGGTFFNAAHRLRECLNGVRKLSIPGHQISYLKTSGTFIPARKGHVSGLLGKHMLISGGMNDKQHVLSDCAILNLQKMTWSYLEITNLELLARAYHSACTISVGIMNESIYRLKGFPIGILIFGGIDQFKKPSNQLINIIPGTKPVKCEVVSARGRPPGARFMHSSVFCSNSKHFIVFGGRIDLNEEREYTCFSDVHLFNINSLCWAQVKVYGSIPVARSAHCAEIVASEMYIFGGVKNSFYCSSEIFKLTVGDTGKYFKESGFRRKSCVE